MARARVNGFSAWVNLRLQPYDHHVTNVLLDLLTGTNMKVLLSSVTGREFRKIQSFNGLTQQQKITRVQWAVEELKKFKLVPEDMHVDSRMFASKGPDHIFSLLWRLVSNDIWFVWERLEFLQHTSDEILTEVPFKWVPEPPPMLAKKKPPKMKSKSLLSGFGASSIITERLEENGEAEVDCVENEGTMAYEPFPGASFMKKFKVKVTDTLPKASECILDFINKHLKMSNEGSKIYVNSMADLADSRVLCALANSVVPNMFPTEILLNDRWTMNLVLRQMEKLLFASSTFSLEDVVEGDIMAICSYFAAFFMQTYKFLQSQAVVTRLESLNSSLRDNQLEAKKFQSQLTSLADVTRSRELETEIKNIKQSIDVLKSKFDVSFCQKWVQHRQDTVTETYSLIHQKMNSMFEVVAVPRTSSMNDLCLSMAINLNLTNGVGFYLAESKETISDRNLVLRDTHNDHFIEEFISKSKTGIIRRTLRLPNKSVIEINPADYPRYEFYFETASKNKVLRSGSGFLYQVFPGSGTRWNKVLQKACKTGELETVQRLVTFFKDNLSFINCKETNTGNTPLHLACRYGHYDVALHLLQNGANIDQQNSYKQTALHSACEGLQRDCAFLLIEWGCNVHIKGPRGMTAFEMIKNDEFRDYLLGGYEHYSNVVPQIMSGNMKLLQEMLTNHLTGAQPLSSLRSRLINGSTVLHTAAYFDCQEIVRQLLKVRVDVNLRDYKGATALHRAHSVETMKLLLEAGANVSAVDAEGNTPLHVKCYGETGQPSDLPAIQLLIEEGAKLTVRNNKNLLPLHCCAMQGRIDVMHYLLTSDTDQEMRQDVMEESSGSPPSVLHLTLANDFLDAAVWLDESGFSFKDGEPDLLMRRILTEQIKVKDKAAAIKFLLDHGASPNPSYPGANTALHFAASSLGSTEVLEVLIAYGANVDCLNEDHATPLFFACQTNNQLAASLLLNCGANFRAQNLHGLMAFDYILEYDEWIECGYFSEEIVARLKAYSLKHARDLIRAISKKVKQSQWVTRNEVVPPGTAYSVSSGLAKTDTQLSFPPIGN